MAEAGTYGPLSWNRLGYKYKGKTYQRVTTIKAKKGSGDALTNWAARMVAEEAQRIAAQMRDEKISVTQGLVSLLDPALAQAHNLKRDAAADFGTVAHEFLEEMVQGDGDALHKAERRLNIVAAKAYAEQSKVTAPTDEALLAYAESLKGKDREAYEAHKAVFHERLWPDITALMDCIDRYKPKMLRQEFPVINDTLGYAGRVDMDIEMGGCRLLADLKTSKGLYADYGLQLAAYRFADFSVSPEGAEAKLPKWDAGVILHCHAGRADFYEIPCGTKEFDAFEACWRLYWWDRVAPKDLDVFHPRLDMSDIYDTATA